MNENPKRRRWIVWAIRAVYVLVIAALAALLLPLEKAQRESVVGPSIQEVQVQHRNFYSGGGDL